MILATCVYITNQDDVGRNKFVFSLDKVYTIAWAVACFYTVVGQILNSRNILKVLIAMATTIPKRNIIIILIITMFTASNGIFLCYLYRK